MENVFHFLSTVSEAKQTSRFVYYKDVTNGTGLVKISLFVSKHVQSISANNKSAQIFNSLPFIVACHFDYFLFLVHL